MEEDVAMGSGKSPRFIPAELYDAFTMSGKVDVDYGYFFSDDFHLGEMTFRMESFRHYAEIVRRKQPNVYDMTDIWLYEALNSHPIQGKTVAVFGSSTPWYESVCLHYGAKKVITFEFREIVSEHPDVLTTTYEKYFEAPFLCDVGISISSFEHDGLGRYGDPIDPFGDFKAMLTASKIIKPGGLLFLAVPVGRDRICGTRTASMGSTVCPNSSMGTPSLQPSDSILECFLIRKRMRNIRFLCCRIVA